MDTVLPLFRVPSCVLFGKKSEPPAVAGGLSVESRNINAKWSIADVQPPATAGGSDLYSNGIAGKEFSGALSVHNCNWDYAEKLLTEQNETYFYLKQGNSSAFSKRSVSNQAVSSI